MEVLYPRCAGIDVHKETAMVCVLTPGPGADAHQEIRQFATHTGELRRLAAWLKQEKVTHAAMESTGVYWKPVFNILESGCELILVNARHIRQVPGRKTDKADCAWLASLLRHGLLEASFVPPPEVRELRELCRMRTTLVRECVQVGNRIRKVLEDANVKLDSVVSNTLGVSGRLMIHALIEGEQDPSVLAELARGRLRTKLAELTAALEGQVRPHHRFLLRQWTGLLATLEQHITEVEQEIERHMPPFEWAAALLVEMPGLDRTAACALLGEIGMDIQRFPSARHLASWAGLCPGNNTSAGKSRSGKSHRGNPWIKGLMTEIAWAATRTKESYPAALYKRLAAHRGKKRALVAVANALLQVVWHLLTRRQPDRDLGPDHFDRINRQRLTLSLVRRLQKLGHTVTLDSAA
jgi:transposase